MSSATKPKTIELYGHGPQHEAKALAAILPGMLIERAVGGVRPHSAAAGGGNLHFANEFGMTGLGIEDEYEVGDQVVFKTYWPGSGIYALLDAGAQVADKGLLVSAGDGTLTPLVAATGGVVVAQANEAVNNTAGAAPARVMVETVIAYYVAPAP